ncbi:hypothetical protein ACFE04_007263 [Oxalis oulophora]
MLEEQGGASMRPSDDDDNYNNVFTVIRCSPPGRGPVVDLLSALRRWRRRKKKMMILMADKGFHNKPVNQFDYNDDNPAQGPRFMMTIISIIPSTSSGISHTPSRGAFLKCKSPSLKPIWNRHFIFIIFIYFKVMFSCNDRGTYDHRWKRPSTLQYGLIGKYVICERKWIDMATSLPIILHDFRVRSIVSLSSLESQIWWSGLGRKSGKGQGGVVRSLGSGGVKCHGMNMDQIEGGGKKGKLKQLGKQNSLDWKCKENSLKMGDCCRGSILYMEKNSIGGVTIMEKLDRIVGSEEWSLMFPNVGVTNLVSSISDHLPVLLDTNTLNHWKTTTSRFKFENFWVDNPKCLNVVKAAWNVNDGWVENVVNVQRQLKDWSKLEFGSLSSQIKRNQQRLHSLLEGDDPCRQANQIREVETRLNGFLDAEAELWRQRSKVMWQVSGDRNTAYFHAVATRRKQHNWIKGMMDECGTWVSDQNKIERLGLEYFEEVFASMNPQFNDCQRITNLIPRRAKKYFMIFSSSSLKDLIGLKSRLTNHLLALSHKTKRCWHLNLIAMISPRDLENIWHICFYFREIDPAFTALLAYTTILGLRSQTSLSEVRTRVSLSRQ